MISFVKLFVPELMWQIFWSITSCWKGFCFQGSAFFSVVTIVLTPKEFQCHHLLSNQTLVGQAFTSGIPLKKKTSLTAIYINGARGVQSLLSSKLQWGPSSPVGGSKGHELLHDLRNMIYGLQSFQCDCMAVTLTPLYHAVIISLHKRRVISTSRTAAKVTVALCSIKLYSGKEGSLLFPASERDSFVLFVAARVEADCALKRRLCRRTKRVSPAMTFIE